jgi:hypothetical protein
MNTRQKSSLAGLLSRSQASASTSESAAAVELPSTPFFDQVVADASGTESFEALLTKITGAVDPAKISQFPTAECLTPEKVYNFDQVGQEQQAHLKTCPWCRNMLAAAQPTNEEFEEIRRKTTSAAKAQRNSEYAAG